MYDRNDMEQEVFKLLTNSDKQVNSMLGLDDEEREQEIIDLLKRSNTEEEIREVLITELLFERMRDTLDDFPYHNRVGI